MVQKLFSCLLVCLVLVACSDREYAEGGRYIQGCEASGSTRMTLQGTFFLAASLTPVSVKVTVVDDNLDSLFAVDADVLAESGGSYIFRAAPADYPSNYVKFSYTCLRTDSSYAMEFVQYADLGHDSLVDLNLFESLESERVEALVQKEHFYLSQAKQKALREIFRVLDCEAEVSKEGKSENSVLTTLWWKPYIYARYSISEPESTFYGLYSEIRSSLGSGKTWRDFSDEAAIMDSLYSRYRNGLTPWADSVNSSNERDLLVSMGLWSEYYGIGSCNDSTRGDTVRVGIEGDSLAGDLLVCAPKVISGHDGWRELDSLETVLGLCLQDTSVLYDSLVYTCDSASMEWSRNPLLDAVKHLFGNCSQDREMEIILFDSTNWTCRCKWRDCEWNNALPEEGTGHYTPVDYFVKQTEGECTEEREGETVALNDAFYICDSTFWVQTDIKTHKMGVCTEDRQYEMFYDKNIGSFMCRWDPYMPSGWKWMEIMLPYYYGRNCGPSNKNEMVFYDDNYFVCDASSWRVAADSELVAPVLEKNFCDSTKLHTFVEYDTTVYMCEDMMWTVPGKYDLLIYNAIKQKKLDPHYCDNRVKNTTIVWDDSTGTLYACNGNETYRKHDGTFGWKVIVETETYNASQDGSNYIGMGEFLAGGLFVTDSTYEVEYKGMYFYFTIRSSYANQRMLVNDSMKIDGVPYVWRRSGGRFFVRNFLGTSSIGLPAVEGKSESFEGFFESWKQHIFSDSLGDSLNSVSLERFGENSYQTLQEAEAFCPEGFRLPDSTEWFSLAPKIDDMGAVVAGRYNRVTKKPVTRKYNLFWTANEKDADTQYCYEYYMKQDDNVSYYWGVVAGGLIECPKDLYPMVQTWCISKEGE